MDFSDKEGSPLIDFYKNKTVFVTGGTGFVGTGVVEKLLYVCKDIKRIYLLMKTSHDESVDTKLTKWIDSSAFERVKADYPDVLKKLVPLSGNISCDNFGLDDEHLRIIHEEVSIVFHMAANVSFDKAISEAVTMNTKASEQIMKICKGIRHLEAFVYVSTAYCNINRKVIQEKVYNTNIPLKDVDYVINNCSNKHLLNQLLDGRPNTYVFSKALSEEIFAQEIRKMPITIVRPSIIISSLREPSPGWLRGWSGISVGTTLLGMNLLRCINGDNDIVLDLVPLDGTVNLILASAWEISKEWKPEKEAVKVYNFCSGLRNPVTFGEYASICKQHFARHSWLPFCLPPFFIKNRKMHMIVLFIVQTIARLLGWLTAGKFAFINRLYLKESLTNVVVSLEYFSTNEYLFIDSNVKELYNKMDTADQQLFDFDITKINWNNFLKLYTEGIEKFVLQK